jgi:hypothetical protein
VLTREEFRETLRKAENAAHDFGSLTNVNDHRHTVRLWNHDAALRAEVDFRAVTIEGLLKQRDEAEAEVERLRTGWDALRERIVALTEGDDSLKARADALAVERDGAVRRGLMILDQKEHFRIKADALAVEVERLVKMLAEQDDEADAAVARVAELTRERDEATLAGRIAECDAVAAWLIAERRSDFPEVELLHMLELRQNEARHAKEKA